MRCAAAGWGRGQGTLNASGLSLSAAASSRAGFASPRTVSCVRPDVILFDEPVRLWILLETSEIDELIQELAEYYTIALSPHNCSQPRASGKNRLLYLGRADRFLDDTSRIIHLASDRRTRTTNITALG